MKYLIVNADDFGASHGINRGILEAHQCGVLTSTSLLVHAACSQEAAGMSRSAPALSVGLHADIPGAARKRGECSPPWLRDELERQIIRFQELMGRPPTHIDSHHNVHRHSEKLPEFLDFARRHQLPLREHSPVLYYSKFYGQWGGRTHLEQIHWVHLQWILQHDVKEGFTELSCHPGYVDPDYPTGYAEEREVELRTLCHPSIRQTLNEVSIVLISYHDFDDMAKLEPSQGDLCQP